MDSLEIERLQRMIDPLIQDQARKIAKKGGYSENFKLAVSMTMNDDFDGSIHAGNVPNIYINANFAIACLGKDKLGIRQLRFLIERLIELVPRFTRSLSNLVPAGFYAALPHEKKRLVKKPKSLFVVDMSRVAVTYSVTVTDIKSGNSVSLDYSNPRDTEETVRFAIKKLSGLADITKEELVEEAPTETPAEPDTRDINYGSASMKSLDFATVRIEYDKEEG